jgi:hypothetical protein
MHRMTTEATDNGTLSAAEPSRWALAKKAWPHSRLAPAVVDLHSVFGYTRIPNEPNPYTRL